MTRYIHALEPRCHDENCLQRHACQRYVLRKLGRDHHETLLFVCEDQ